jgi:hypothetical protein
MLLCVLQGRTRHQSPTIGDRFAMPPTKKHTAWAADEDTGADVGDFDGFDALSGLWGSEAAAAAAAGTGHPLCKLTIAGYKDRVMSWHFTLCYQWQAVVYS